MAYHTRMTLLLLVTALPVLVGAFRFPLLNKSGKIFYGLCVFSLATESAAYYTAVQYHSNIMVYNVCNVGQMFLACLFFNQAIPGFRKRNIGMAIGILSVILGLLNFLYLQPVQEIADYFLLYQALVMIGLCIIGLLPALKLQYPDKNVQAVDFWFIVILGSYRTVTYFLFSVIKFYTWRSPDLALECTWGLYAASVLWSLGATVVFLNYPKLLQHV
ncbi:MAG TPA: hypothetical protein VHA56_12055 [Mucilaginibacter sp.]|nr:hypothetical protein [Mucilaginibacter sp.]